MDADETPIFDRAADTAEQDRAATHANNVAFLIEELKDAAAGPEAAQAASFALATIQRHALKRGRQALSPIERDQILVALLLARENILDMVAGAKSTRRAFALCAHQAACALVTLWSEKDPHNRPRELLTEIIDRCRWLRNALHNLAIEQQLRRRCAPKVQRAVDDLKAQVLEVRNA